MSNQDEREMQKIMAPIANPFATTAPARHTAIADAHTAQQVQEIQAALTVAMHCPRDEREAFNRILIACESPSLADEALYEYSRGGQLISGPSIRLAEAMAQQWGNVDFGVREMDSSDKETVVESYAWDQQTNTRMRKIFTVPHIRATRSGSYALTDPRDVYEHVANFAARRMRACILALIPKSVQAGAVQQCQQTMIANMGADPEKVQAAVDSFARWGITPEQIGERFQRDPNTLTPVNLVSLRGIYRSLSDGMSKPETWFGKGAASSGNNSNGSATTSPNRQQADGDPWNGKRPEPTQSQQKPQERANTQAAGNQASKQPAQQKQPAQAQEPTQSAATEASNTGAQAQEMDAAAAAEYEEAQNQPPPAHTATMSADDIARMDAEEQERHLKEQRAAAQPGDNSGTTGNDPSQPGVPATAEGGNGEVDPDQQPNPELRQFQNPNGVWFGEFYDADGRTYWGDIDRKPWDATLHAWSKAKKRPAYTKMGFFRARRSDAGASDAGATSPPSENTGNDSNQDPPTAQSGNVHGIHGGQQQEQAPPVGSTDAQMAASRPSQQLSVRDELLRDIRAAKDNVQLNFAIKGWNPAQDFDDETKAAYQAKLQELNP